MRHRLMLPCAIALCAAALPAPVLAQPEAAPIVRTEWSLDKPAAKAKQQRARAKGNPPQRVVARGRSTDGTRAGARVTNSGRGKRASVGVALPF